MTIDGKKAGPSQSDLNAVAMHALRLVESGMVLGLGTGRAAEAFIRALGEAVARGLRVQGVPTSVRSELLARECGIPVVDLEKITHLDIAFDGADEVTAELQLTKGLGGALLRERVVAYEAQRFVVLVTPEKLVNKLGVRSPIPVELVPFAIPTASRHISQLGGAPLLRTQPDGVTFLTDNGNAIVNTQFPPIEDPAELHRLLRAIPGVIDTGIFLELADVVIVGDAGQVRELRA